MTSNIKRYFYSLILGFLLCPFVLSHAEEAVSKLPMEATTTNQVTTPSKAKIAAPEKTQTKAEESVEDDEDIPTNVSTQSGAITPVATSSGDSGDTIEKLSVIGSRIRRLNLSTPSPVQVITREEIEKSGHNSVGAVLRDSTLASFGGSASQISVRGMGGENSLVLLNGKRLPKTGSFYGSTSPSVNAIPLSAVERVEILSDGASAVYGSEALGSVINVVTRKDLNGVTAETKLTMTGPEGGDTLRASVTYGQSSARSHFNTSLEYMQFTPLYYRELNYINPYSLRDPRFSDNYHTKNIPSTPFSNCTSIDEERGGVCSQDYSHISRKGTSSVISNFSELSYDFNSSLTFKADFLGRFGKGSDYRPVSMRLEFGPDEKLPLSWKRLLSKRKDGETLTFSHRISHLEQEDYDSTTLMGGNIGLEGNFGEDWAWSLTNHIATKREKSARYNMVLINESKQAILSEQYKPFGPDGKDVSDDGKDLTGMLHTATSQENYLVDTVDLSTDGTLFTTENLSLSMAMGLQFGYHSYDQTSDKQTRDGNVSELRGVKGSGDRTQQSIYTELGSTYSDWLELQLATRFDNYSDFGSTLNPKLAMKALLSPWLTLRSSMGTGFKAPELPYLHTGNASAYLTLRDYRECKKDPEKSELL